MSRSRVEPIAVTVKIDKSWSQSRVQQEKDMVCYMLGSKMLNAMTPEVVKETDELEILRWTVFISRKGPFEKPRMGQN